MHSPVGQLFPFLKMQYLPLGHEKLNWVEGCVLMQNFCSMPDLALEPAKSYGLDQSLLGRISSVS